MSLVFDTAAPPPAADPRRADVACFVGHVGRRAGRPLSAAHRAQLDAAGWVQGPWRRGEDELQSLLNLPLALDSFSAFDELYAWDRRPLRAGSSETCACPLGAAVRSFFARGGRRAVVLRVGDPWPVVETAAAHTAARRERIRRLLPEMSGGDSSPQLFAPHDPRLWQGAHHLAGLREPSLLLLPDLPDICGLPPPGPAAEVPMPAVPTAFVECSTNEPRRDDSTLARLPAPRLDDAGYALWAETLRLARRLLARRELRETLLVAALPLPRPETRGSSAVHAQVDMPAFLRALDVIPDPFRPAPPADDPGARSAFLQLAWPWLATRAATDLPQGLEAPDGALAGLIAAGAVAQGSFRSVAGDFSLPRLRDVGGTEPQPNWGAAEDTPDALLARHVCVFAPQPGGYALQSDVTPSADPAWRFGGASRLMGSLLRTARAAGDALAFELNGPATWAQVRRSMEQLFEAFWREGAFGGRNADEAYAVRCDRQTMTQADLDAGRLVVEISVLPAASIERITVVLALNTAGAAALREAA